MKTAGLQPSARTRHRHSSRVRRAWTRRWFHPQLELLECRCLLSITPGDVVGRFVFYDHSHFDGNVAGINDGDGAAIATDKSALLPGAGPGPGPATVTFTANDGTNVNSPLATAATTFTVDSLPVIDLDGNLSDGTGFSSSWINSMLPYASGSGGGNVFITGVANATVADAESANLTGMTVSMAPFHVGDWLSASNAGTSIAAPAYNNVTGVLTLSGSDTLAHYQTVLRTLKYTNISTTLGGPVASSVTANVQANDGLQLSNVAVASVAVRVPPIVDLNGNAGGLDYLSVWKNTGAVPIVDPTLASVIDGSSSNVTQMTATIVPFNANNLLSANTAGTSISASYNGDTGLLTLSGTDSTAHYQTVLRTVTYNNTGGGPGVALVTVNFVGTDGVNSSATAVGKITINTTAASNVVGRNIFYNKSGFDGNDVAVTASDDAAIASDKVAYIPGTGAATFNNVTSYDKGINAIMIDISGSHLGITASDFVFSVGNNNTSDAWSTASAPTTVSVRAGGGGAGRDRVEITWDNVSAGTGFSTIAGKWLEVIFKGNDTLGGSDANTGLAASDVFFFGNAPGETGDGATQVNATDIADTQKNPRGLANLTPITFNFDFSRDKQVNATDIAIAQSHPTSLSTGLKLINVSGAGLFGPVLNAGFANDTGPNGQPNNDGITADPTVIGTLTSAAPITSFTAELDSGPLTDALSLLQPNGTFTMNEAFFTTVNGGSLPDGTYTLHLRAVDAYGLGAPFDGTGTLKRSIATPSSPDLIAADDSGASNTDNITKINAPRIDVTAESGSLVQLLVDDVQVAQGTAGPTIQFALAALADGTHQIKVISQDGAGNSATSPTLQITISTALPAVTVATLVSFTDDLTPHVTVTGGDPLGLANDTQVSLDVDLNNDGSFSGSGETSRTLSSLYNGSSYFQLTPALPATDPLAGPYLVQLRARITDVAGNEGKSPLQSLLIDSLGNNILSDYVHAADSSWAYTTPNSTAPTTIAGTGYAATVYDLHSQTWLTTADVSQPLWKHWMTVIVPNGNLAQLSSTAILLIDGGSINDARPTTVSSNLALIATTLNTVVIDLRMVPNEPLTFANDAGSPRSEDQIISYTFNQYTTNLDAHGLPLPGYEDWPALLPMVKSAVKAMDTVQAVDTGLTGGKDINDFVVTGYSKRGWTTWLTAAVDNRVRAIIPGVIDVLNMDEQMMHHYGFYGGVTTFTVSGFSVAIQDYVGFNIPQNVQTLGGQELGRVVDPYRYLNNGHFNIPKLIINSSGDEFFVPDSSEFYFSDLPGTQNYLRYIPNTGHGLDSTQTTNSTIAFANAVIKNLPLPQYSWTVQPDGSIRVQTNSSPTSVLMWRGTNPDVRDFRNSLSAFHVTYTSSALSDQGGGVYVASVPTPASGATAFFIELTFPSPISGKPYIFTTQIKVASNTPLAPWPYFVQPPSGGAVAAGFASDDRNALVSGLASPAVLAAATPNSQTSATSASATPAPTAEDEDDDVGGELLLDGSWDDRDSMRGDLNPVGAEATDLALSLLGEGDLF